MQGDFLSFMSVAFNRQVSEFMDRRQASANGSGIHPWRRDHPDDCGMRLGSDAPDMKVGDMGIAVRFNGFAHLNRFR